MARTLSPGGKCSEARHGSMSGLPADLLMASVRLDCGDLDGAEAEIRRYLGRHGPHLEGMRLLASVCVSRKEFDDAERLLEAVVLQCPDYRAARYELALVYAHLRRFHPALRQAKCLLRSDSSNRDARLLYAKACDGLGRFEEALRIYRELRDESPGCFGLEFLIADVLRIQGNVAEAIAGFQHAKCFLGGASLAYAALADIKSYQFSDDEISAMEEAEAASLDSTAERYRLCFALGKALEDRKRYPEAFRYFERGNGLKQSECRYDPDTTDANFIARQQLFSAEFLATRRGVGCQSFDPIFIVGLPRSGSTLIEQILASHSQVDGTMELPEIPRLVRQFRGRRPDEPPRFPRILAELTGQELRRLGEVYLEETKVYRAGAPFFIDKLPSNFQEIGFIHLILPNARIIDARRDAMACCVSNFTQLFFDGQEFSYDLGYLGRYYRAYERLMEHWDKVLPGKVLRVRHSDMVNDFEGTVRRLLDHCGLTFEASCLEFHKTVRSVRTLSSEQVRRPINRDGVDRWRHFEPWLGPLRSALSEVTP